jgi:hypothetical protein
LASGGQAPHAIVLVLVVAEAEGDALATGAPLDASDEHDVVMPTTAPIPAISAVAAYRLVRELRGWKMRVIVKLTPFEEVSAENGMYGLTGISAIAPKL